jgi:hypothetical protein
MYVHMYLCLTFVSPKTWVLYSTLKCCKDSMKFFGSLFSPDLYCKLTALSYHGQKHGLRFSLYYESRDSFSCFLRQLQVESPREIGATLEGKSGAFFWVL